MNPTTLNILHLRPNTGIQKVDEVAQLRYDNLMEELENQGITDYKIWDGEYKPENTKLAISEGHHRIVQDAKDSNLPFCIVAEDDIKFTHANSWQYFLIQIPEDFDLFFGLIYAGDILENRVMNGFSGGMSLYAVSQKFYDEFLAQPLDTHIDRNLGQFCYNHDFYVIKKYCVEQRGGYSHQKRQILFYESYLIGKEMYNG